MSFRIIGLSPEPFRHLFGLDEPALAVQGAQRVCADRAPGYPDRIELRDARPGESLLLVNHVHQPAATPYRASHAIFVLEGASEAYDRVDTIPAVLSSRHISLRAFDADHMMVDALLTPGEDSAQGIARLLANERVSYLHAHFAARGCYAARIERA